MDAATYVLCRGYVKKTAEALGAVKGAPCTIKSIVDGNGGHTVTFEWVGDNNVKQTTTMFVKDGTDGVSVVGVTVDANNHIICTMSDGTTIDAGGISVSAETTSPITTTTSVGGIKSDTTYPAGTGIEDIITDMLVEYKMPTVSISLDPGRLVYDVVNESVSEITITGNVVKGTKDIVEVVFRVNGVVWEIVTNNVKDGGTFSYTWVPSSPVNTTTSFSVSAFDGDKVAVAPSQINFYAKSYYGVVSSDVASPDETHIKELYGILKSTKEYAASPISAAYARIVYAYPKSFGTISSIIDTSYGLNYEDSFTLTEVKVDNIDYYVYTQTDPSSIENIKLRFA